MSTEGHARRLLAPTLLCLLVFLGLFAALKDEPIMLPQFGEHAVQAAASAARGDGLTLASGRPLAKYAPLYALLLAVPAKFDLGVVPSLYFINVLALACAVLGAFQLARALEIQRSWAFTGLFGLLAANVYLVRVARPELVVLAAALWSFVGMARYLADGRLRDVLAAALAAAAAACGHYYALLILLPFHALALLWARRSLRDAALFLALALAPMLLWTVRNLQLTGHALGASRTADRPQAEITDLGTNLVGLVQTVGLDGFSFAAMGVRPILYGERVLPQAGLLLLVVGFALLATGWVAWVRRHELVGFLVLEVWGRTRTGRVAGLVLGYALWYPGALLFLWTVGNNDPLSTVYVGPTYVWLLASAWILGQAALGPGAPRRVRAVLLILPLLIAAPNAWKSFQLLGPEPSEDLLQTTRMRGGPTRWCAAADWDGRIEWDDGDEHPRR